MKSEGANADVFEGDSAFVFLQPEFPGEPESGSLVGEVDDGFFVEPDLNAWAFAADAEVMPVAFDGGDIGGGESSDEAAGPMCGVAVADVEFVGIERWVGGVIGGAKEDAAVSTWCEVEGAAEFEVIEVEGSGEQAFFAAVGGDFAVFHFPIGALGNLPAKERDMVEEADPAVGDFGRGEGWWEEFDWWECGGYGRTWAVVGRGGVVCCCLFRCFWRGGGGIAAGEKEGNEQDEFGVCHFLCVVGGGRGGGVVCRGELAELGVFSAKRDAW